MVTVAIYDKKHGKKVLDYIKEHDLYKPHYKTFSQDTNLCTPVKKEFVYQNVTFTEIPQKELQTQTKALSFKEELANILTPEEIPLCKYAYDIIGTIAIIEIDLELRHKETQIAQTLLQTNPAIKSIFRKDSAHSGKYRIQSYKYLGGENTTLTKHIENNAILWIDIKQVYFSPRLANERLRIAKQIQKGETILHMFSGCAPYECVIGKYQKNCKQIGIELNPAGHELGIKNIYANKLQNVQLICNSAQNASSILTNTFDRIIMNLPKTAYEFLDEALKLSKDNTIIHYYDFLKESEFDIAIQRIQKACEKHNFTVKILGIHTCGTQGVRTHRICVDCKLKKTM